MSTFSSVNKATGLAVLALAVGSCFGAKKDPSQFYVLNSAAVDGTAGAAGSAGSVEGKIIGVGPVRFPAYLDRPQMVTRISDVQVTVSEFERWAESPELNFTAVLARNLEVQLGTPRIATFPWIAGVDYAVRIEVHRFERDASGTTELECRWVIIDSDREPVVSAESSFREPAADATTDAAVAALSRTVERLSVEIAGALRQLPADD